MIKYIIIAFLIIPSLHAFDINEALTKLEDHTESKTEKKLSLSNLTDGLKSEANQKIADIEAKINNKIDSYDKKINAEIDNASSKIKEQIQEIEGIKNQAYGFLNKVETILKWAKIFIAIISSAIVVILFFVYRALKRIEKLEKS